MRAYDASHVLPIAPAPSIGYRSRPFASALDLLESEQLRSRENKAWRLSLLTSPSRDLATSKLLTKVAAQGTPLKVATSLSPKGKDRPRRKLSHPMQVSDRLQRCKREIARIVM